MADNLGTTERFNERVPNYARYRPSYPDELFDELEALGYLQPRSVVVDLGAGTGISSNHFLERGHTVYAVEPNAQMAAEASSKFANNPGFVLVNAPAEDTGLRDEVADIVVSFQAFHWLNPKRARIECERILKQPGYVVAVWNLLIKGFNPFMEAYESFLLSTCEKYPVRTEETIESSLAVFFDRKPDLKTFRSVVQKFNWEGLRGRFLSASSAPQEGEENHDRCMTNLRKIFDEFESNGEVSLHYETKLRYGAIRD